MYKKVSTNLDAVEREKEIISYKDKQNADTFHISELENEITKLKELIAKIKAITTTNTVATILPR